MVISNIGTIVLSLPPSSSTSSTLLSNTQYSPASATATQVRLLSISNTVSRLLVGPLADFVSPVASYLPCGTIYFSRKHRISRIAFLTVSSVLLFLTYANMEFFIRSRAGIWMLRFVIRLLKYRYQLIVSFSIGTGIAYGSVFTALPGIVSSVWGLSNLGRNFGIITYAPFIGTPFFSYLYAFVSASHATDGEVCKGTQCWRLTFAVTTIASLSAFVVSIVLWRRWKGRV